MSQTVLGIFENQAAAQWALERLQGQGFSREHVNVAGGSSDAASEAHDESDFGDSISNFFSSLFGGDHDRTNRFSELARRGCVVTVNAQSESEAERASDILNESGATEVDVNADQDSKDYSGSNLVGTDFTSVNLSGSDVSSDTARDNIFSNEAKEADRPNNTQSDLSGKNVSDRGDRL